MIPAPNFVVKVEDRSARFLPQVLLLCLPKERLLEVPLFSAPTRQEPAGMGVVRGQVWDRAADRAASWALITVSPGDATTYVAVADAHGVFALFLPYASALPPLVGSPPRGSARLDQLQWTLTIQVFYEPARQRRVAGLDPADPPDTRSILEQAGAAVYDAPGPPGPQLTRPLSLGRDVVVHTVGHSELLVDPA